MTTLAALQTTDVGYEIIKFVHLVAVVVGFGAVFTYSVFTARARSHDLATRGAILTDVARSASRFSDPIIVLAGVTGFVLVLVGDPWEFSSAWVSASFAVFILAALAAYFVLNPALRRTAAAATAGDAVAADTEAKRAAMFTGILHLSFLVLVVLMVFKPGA